MCPHPLLCLFTSNLFRSHHHAPQSIDIISPLRHLLYFSLSALNLPGLFFFHFLCSPPQYSPKPTNAPLVRLPVHTHTYRELAFAWLVSCPLALARLSHFHSPRTLAPQRSQRSRQGDPKVTGKRKGERAKPGQTCALCAALCILPLVIGPYWTPPPPPPPRAQEDQGRQAGKDLLSISMPGHTRENNCAKPPSSSSMIRWGGVTSNPRLVVTRVGRRPSPRFNGQGTLDEDKMPSPSLCSSTSGGLYGCGGGARGRAMWLSCSRAARFLFFLFPFKMAHSPSLSPFSTASGIPLAQGDRAVVKARGARACYEEWGLNLIGST